MKKLKSSRVFPYFACMAVLTVLLGAVYALKGITPFGANTIDYFDGTQVALPNLYQWWDILHRRTSLFYDWYEALGTPILPCYLPDYLLLWFFPRTSVAAFPSLLLWLRLMLASCTMQFALRRMFKVDAGVGAVAGLLYACCGFALKYYVIFIWLDFVALFPLVVLGVWQLLRENRRFWLVASIAVLFALNVYMAAFVLLFVLFISGFTIFAFLPRQKQGQSALWLAVSVVQGVLLSAVMMLPIAIIELGSDRAGLVGTGLLGHLQNYLAACMAASGSYALTVSNLGILMGMGAPLAFLLAKLIAGIRKGHRTEKFLIAGLLALLLPLAVESVNLAWHFGSYTLFPVRYGYMIPCMILVGCGWFCREKSWAEVCESCRVELYAKQGRGTQLFVIAVAVVVCVWQMMVQARLVNQNGADQAGPGVKIWMVLVGVLFALTYANFAVRGLLTQKAGLAAVSLLLAVQLGGSLYAFIGPANRVGAFEQQPEFVADCAELNEQLGSSTDLLSRVKNADTSLNNNYPLVLGQPALSGWTDGIWTDTIDGGFRTLFAELGYSTSYTRILDQGGTLFTDAFLGAKRVIANSETAVNPAAATLSQQLGSYQIYDAVYQLPAGLCVNAAAAETAVPGKDVVQNQNLLYSLVSGDSEPLLTSVPATDAQAGNLHFTADAACEVYLEYSGSTEIEIFKDGGIVTNPYYQRPYNKAYPSEFCNGLVDLGRLDAGQSTEIVVAGYQGAQPTAEELSTLRLIVMDLEKLEALCQTAQGANGYAAGGRHMSWQKDDSAADTLLLLPVQYSSGWHCTLNGQRVEPVEVMGGLMALPLIDGDCNIQCSFWAPGFLLGAALTMIGGLLTLLLWVLVRRGVLSGSRQTEGTLSAVARILLAAAFGAGVLAVYLVPLLCAAVSLVFSF